MRFNGQIEPAIAAALRALPRQERACLVVEQEWDEIGQGMNIAERAHARRPEAHLTHAVAIERVFLHADESTNDILVVLVEGAALGAPADARQRIRRE